MIACRRASCGRACLSYSRGPSVAASETPTFYPKQIQNRYSCKVGAGSFFNE